MSTSGDVHQYSTSATSSSYHQQSHQSTTFNDDNDKQQIPISEWDQKLGRTNTTAKSTFWRVLGFFCTQNFLLLIISWFEFSDYGFLFFYTFGWSFCALMSFSASSVYVFSESIWFSYSFDSSHFSFSKSEWISDGSLYLGPVPSGYS